ncbi:MAG: bifunctional glycosyltransferase family 2/GtrA family protein, partial [Clostridia bacterium]|nr:bifunctional glycosyltransferase family 2/GtrA family protein [Clostridia bacterium]
EQLAKTVKGMLDIGFESIVLVDDGSDAEHKANFPAESNSVTVLTHEVNKGKGAALKTAFAYINENFPDAFGVVTADGDGQHTPQDVLRCAEAIEDKRQIILGCRDFSGEDVPGKSRFGNKTTSFIFKTLCGKAISDTQTGLRGFPGCLLSYLCDISGDRFEYETNMLLRCISDRVDIKEIKIETVYLDSNKATHFRPIRDSIRIYKFLINYILSSFISFVADISLFYVFSRLFSRLFADSSPMIPIVATVCARAISSGINYYINRTKVFESKQQVKKTLLKYYALAIPQMLVSAGAVTLLTVIFGAHSFGSSIIKIFVDTVIFLVSFRIQKSWVFKGEKNV